MTLPALPASVAERADGVAANDQTITVKVSAKSARLRFNGCDPEYIRTVCHGACCRSPSSATGTGTLITIHSSEEMAIRARGGIVQSGILQPAPGCRQCPFQGTEHLCGLHNTPDKPFGCIASPFTLNKNKTLIVRNRYKLLRCYDSGPRLPAYVAFRSSLDLLFGPTVAADLCDHLASGGGDILAPMPQQNVAMLLENDAVKHALIAAG